MGYLHKYIKHKGGQGVKWSWNLEPYQTSANQGLYNGFLAAGIKVFFLCCVLIAGLFGAATASRKILFVQALPATIGLSLVLLS